MLKPAMHMLFLILEQTIVDAIMRTRQPLYLNIQ